MHFRIVVIAMCAATVFVVSCSAARDMRDMQQQTDKAAEQLLRDVRARPQIGFNLNNGHLSFVNVTFASVDVSDRNIAELESLVRQALKKTLVEQPQQIVVSVQSAGGPQ